MALLQSGTRIYGHAIIDTSLSIGGSDAATSNSTGALTVAGGIGVAGNVFSSGNLTAVDGIFSGNLVVNGSTVYANVATLNIKDPIIEQGGNPNGSPLSVNDNKDRGSLLHYYSSAPTDAFMGWKNANSEFVFASNASTTNNIVTVNQLGNVRASTFIGTLSGSADTVTTAAQPNITSVGTLTSLAVSGSAILGDVSNVHVQGGSNGYVLQTDGTGNLSWTTLPSSTTSTITVDSFTGNGVQTTFTLSTTPNNVNQTTVNYNGTTLLRSAYSLDGATIVFSGAPANNSLLEVTTTNLLTGASNSTPWSIINSNITAQTGHGYFVDTSIGAVTLTLPTSASLGDVIKFNDLAGTFSTNNLTIARNGHNIQGAAADWTDSTSQSSVSLTYSNSTYGWKLLAA